MPMNQALLPEFDHEMANTRKTLERVPDDKLSWKPHQKSMSMGQLANHLANLPGWGADMMGKDSYDVATEPRPPEFKSRKEMLDAFDNNVKQAREAISKADDAQLGKPWSLLNGGQPIFTQPRAAILRGLIFNHLIHHRAQLGVYLRLNDVPVPSIYGPSADESGM
jgi:uncharacterized damage-inducible protein DinB